MNRRPEKSGVAHRVKRRGCLRLFVANVCPSVRCLMPSSLDARCNLADVAFVRRFPRHQHCLKRLKQLPWPLSRPSGTVYVLYARFAMLFDVIFLRAHFGHASSSLFPRIPSVIDISPHHAKCGHHLSVDDVIVGKASESYPIATMFRPWWSS
jgi:hypothetical protein